MIVVLSSLRPRVGIAAYLMGNILPHVLNLALLAPGVQTSMFAYAAAVVAGCVVLLPVICAYTRDEAADAEPRSAADENAKPRAVVDLGAALAHWLTSSCRRFPMLYVGGFLFTLLYRLNGQICVAYEVGTGIALPPTAFGSELASVVVLALAFVPIVASLPRASIETYFVYVLPVIVLGVFLIPTIDIDLLWLPWAIVKHASLLYHFIVGAFLVYFPFGSQYERMFTFGLFNAVSGMGTLVGYWLGDLFALVLSLDTAVSMVATSLLVWGIAMSFWFLWRHERAKRLRAELSLGAADDGRPAGTGAAADGATPLAGESGEGAGGEQLSGLARACGAQALSEREAEVLELYAAGRSAERIGQMLYLSTATVRTYIQRIYGKLGVHSRQELLDCLNEWDAR